MSDLSRLLDDLYSDETPTLALVPSWSSDEALDEAFSSWVPGPGADASSAERAIVAGALNDVVFAPASTIDEWQRSDPVLVERPRWSPSDDDILPVRKRRR